MISLLILVLLAPLKIDPGLVPISLQTLVLFVLSSWLKPSQALLLGGLYLLMGGLGLPVFAGYQGGWSKLVGPTAGFLWAFPLLGAGLAHQAQGGSWHFFQAMLYFFIAHITLLIPGFLVLKLSLEGAMLWPTFVRLIPGLLLKSIFGGILSAWLKTKLPPWWAGGEKS